MTLNETSTENIISGSKAIVLTLFYALFIVVGLSTNLAIIFAVLRTKGLRKRQQIILLNLVTCDGFTIVMSAPYYIYSVNVTKIPPRTMLGTRLCKTYLLFSYALGFVSILSLLLISIDRYTAVVYPYFHQRHMTREKLICFSVLCWLIPSIVCVPAANIPGWLDFDGQPGGLCGVQWSKINPGYVIFSVGSLFLLPTFVIFYANIRVYLIAKRKRRRIFPSGYSKNSEEDSNNSGSVHGSVRSLPLGVIATFQRITSIKKSIAFNRRFRTSKQDVQIAVSTLLLIGLFLLSWLPFVIPRVLHTFKIRIPEQVSNYTPVFAFSNVALDPILIFCCRNEIRKAVISFFRNSTITEMEIKSTDNVKQ